MGALHRPKRLEDRVSPECGTVLLAAGLLLLYIGALTYAVFQISQGTQLTSLEKWMWSVALIITPAITLVAWYLIDPTHSRKLRGIN